ncbi:hypothetical protein GCM10022209_23130 [Chitinophaga oryziterrae]
MKRAKFMLAAIAVLAIAGGVYASKANRGSFLYCSTTTNTTGTLLTNWTTTNVPGITTYCTLAPDELITKSTLITPRI